MTPTKLTYTVDELSAATSIGRTKIYQQVKAGRLRPSKIGDRTLFPVEEVKRWLEASMADGGSK